MCAGERLVRQGDAIIARKCWALEEIWWQWKLHWREVANAQMAHYIVNSDSLCVGSVGSKTTVKRPAFNVIG